MKLEEIEQLYEDITSLRTDENFFEENISILLEQHRKLLAVAKAAKKTQMQSTSFRGDAIVELHLALQELEKD